MATYTAVKLDRDLCERAAKAAEDAGYSSLREFVQHAIEKELVHREHEKAKDAVLNRLKGLGYLE